MLLPALVHAAASPCAERSRPPRRNDAAILRARTANARLPRYHLEKDSSFARTRNRARGRAPPGTAGCRHSFKLSELNVFGDPCIRIPDRLTRPWDPSLTDVDLPDLRVHQRRPALLGVPSTVLPANSEHRHGLRNRVRADDASRWLHTSPTDHCARTTRVAPLPRHGIPFILRISSQLVWPSTHAAWAAGTLAPPTQRTSAFATSSCRSRLVLPS
ncbi:hypothetical protein C8Q80DRAFT_28403 [Daedaleopsis nitida]|nr:hypothetical protein C8Q80DRAFT_28403 [Daedaleopsis nitida]